MTRFPDDLARQHPGAWKHFRRRVAERLSGVDAFALWKAMRREMGNPNGAVSAQFVGRTKHNKARRIWRVDVCAISFFFVYDHEMGVPLTVVPNADVVELPGGGVALRPDEMWALAKRIRRRA